MAFEKYVKLPGSARTPMAGATPTGSLDPNELMQVTVSLRPRASGAKQPSLDKLIASGKRISRDEYAARYGADPADARQVAAFASAHGLAVAEMESGARLALWPCARLTPGLSGAVGAI